MAWKRFVFDKTMLPHRIHISLFIRLSQPTHLLALILVSYLAFVIFPEEPKLPWQPSTLSALLYISTFATHFGTQIWMTFISGIVLFFNLPRKLFGMVQRQLFPKYFMLNSILGFITLFTFILHNPTTSSDNNVVQRWALTLCFICDLLGMVYIVPTMIVTMETRSALEQSLAPSSDQQASDIAKLNCSPQYFLLHKRFRRLHGVCAIVNFVAIFCNAIHMYHLACKLRSVLT